MAEEENTVKDISICISKELERKGHSKHKLNVTSWLVKICEYIENRERGAQPLFNTGSNAEGTDVTGSDRDQMVAFPDCTVVADDKAARHSPKESNVFLMAQDDIRPCYTKLVLLRKGQNSGRSSDMFHRLGGKEQLCVKDKGGQYLFSSEEFTKQLTNHVSGIVQSSQNHILSSFHVHGPCATFDNTIGKTKFDADFAYFLPCGTVPREAAAFSTRQRRHHWPPKTLIKNFLDRGCHIVAVGDKASETNSVEWRISFALLERELVWSLNDTLCKCYIMLKMLLKLHIEKVAPDELSSYAVKTLIFWCAETDDPAMWREENLLRCVYHCLSKLHAHVSKKRLPHFIMPENNLLATKFLDKKVHTNTKELISEMVKWPWYRFLQCPSLSALNRVWEEVGRDVRLFLRASRHPNVALPFYQDIVTFRALQSLYMDINCHQTSSEDLLKTLESLELVQAESDEMGFLEFAICALKYGKSHLLMETRKSGCFLFSEAVGRGLSSQGEESILYDRTTNSTSKEKMQEAYLGKRLFSSPKRRHQLVTLESPGVCTAGLRTALNLLLNGEFSRADVVLHQVMDSYGPHVIYLGMCGPEEMDLIEYSCYTASSGNLSLLEKAQRLLIFDFTISKCDEVPPFLKREQQFWDEDVVPLCIHPRIIAYYLCFLSAYGQGDKENALGYTYILSMHINAMYKNKNLYSYLAWNLLGQCYFLVKKYGRAFKAFSHSLISKPLHNPALYYIGQC